MLQYLQKRPNI